MVVAAWVVAVVPCVVVTPLPVDIDRLNPLTVNTASDPVKTSVPAPTLCRYWLVGNPYVLIRYVKNAIRSPLNDVTSDGATKLYTCIAPL